MKEKKADISIINTINILKSLNGGSQIAVEANIIHEETEEEEEEFTTTENIEYDQLS